MDATYEDLWELYRKFVHWIVQKQVSPNNPDYEDYVQQASVLLWQAYTRYDAAYGCEFITFAYLVVNRGLRNLYSRNRRRRSVISFIYLDAPLPGQENLCFADVLAGAEQDMTDMDLRNALERLSQEDKRLLTTIIWGYKQAEIPQIMSVSRSSSWTTKKTRAARERLRNLYEKGLPAPQTQTAHTS